LPIGSTDHTAFTRSINDDQGPEWRGEVVREQNDQTLAATNNESAIDAEEMDTPESCAEGTTFSFVRRQCIPVEEADAEDVEEFARNEAEEPVDEAALSKDLAQYGVNLTANYPFISPITQQHLMRIPRETIDLMSRYLEGKGISFQDFLSVSAGWYGGGGQARTRWEVPRQWG